MTGIDTAPWREGLAAMADPAVSAVLTIQCAIDWLRPGACELRDEIDAALIAALLARDGLAVDRIVLHSLPVMPGLAPGEQAALNAAHADWLYRLAAVSALLPQSRRPRVHRLIVGGAQRSVDLIDGFHVYKSGALPTPDPAAAAWQIVRRGGAVTPLTSYDIDMDGPFGDADPSIYL